MCRLAWPGLPAHELYARGRRNSRHAAGPWFPRAFRDSSDERGEKFMFCPRCGQQQASEEARFCSRCGLQLEAVAEYVEGGGQLAARGGEEDLPALTPRQRGTRKGVLILVAGLIFGLIAAFLTAVKEDFLPFLFLAA